MTDAPLPADYPVPHPPETDPKFQPSAADPLVARAGRYYRNMRYLMVLGIIIFAGFFAYDGFKRYPAQNAEIEEVTTALANAHTDEDRTALAKRQHELHAPHTETDIALQKKLAVALPFVAIGYLIFVLYRSRGEIRLQDDTLSAPGYAPFPLSAVTSIDDSLWKKKGIAVVHFTQDGKAKSLRLDDFIYEQKPIDAMYDRLKAVVGQTATV